MTDKTRSGADSLLRKQLPASEQYVAQMPERLPWAAIAKPVLGYFYDLDADVRLFETEKAISLMASAALFGIGWGLAHRSELPKHYDRLVRHQESDGEPLQWPNVAGFMSECERMTQHRALAKGPLPSFA